MFVRISKLVFVITFFFIFKFYNVDAAMVEFDLTGTVNKRNIADVGGGSDHMILVLRAVLSLIMMVLKCLLVLPTEFAKLEINKIIVV